jgi:hypothetical protein
MKIKKIGWTSFLISNANISAMTDPLMLSEAGVSFPKTSSDIIVVTNYGKNIRRGYWKIINWKRK